MRRTRGLAAVLAVAALTGGAAVAAASSAGGGSTTTTTTTPTTTGTIGTTTSPPNPTPGERMHGGPGRRGGFGSGFAFGFRGGAGLDWLDSASKTALTETFTGVQAAQKSATDAGKSPDGIRDAAVAAATTRLDQAVTDGALTRAQAAALLAAMTRQVGAHAAVIDAAATVLELTPTELARRLDAGDRLDEIARAQGVAIADVRAAIQQVDGRPGPGFGFGFGFGGRDGLHGGPGRDGPGHHGFGGRGSWQKGGITPAPPATTQPSTQSGSFAPSALTTTI